VHGSQGESHPGDCGPESPQSPLLFNDGIGVYAQRTAALAGLLCTLLLTGGWPSTAVSAADPVSSPASAEPAPAPFDIWEIRVLGNTTLPVRDVERAVYATLGGSRSMHDLEAARDALVKAYRERGFGAVFVDIPEQEVTDGLVRLQVTEGRLGRVRVTGARYFSNGRLLAQLPALARGEVLNVQSLQSQIADVDRQSRDRSVTPVLRAGQTPGTVDLDLKVKDNLPIHGSVELNNRYTANTSPLRIAGSLSYDNLFQSLQSFSLQYQTAPSSPQQSRVLAGTYVIPISSMRQLAFYAVDTNSDVATVGALSVVGAGKIFGARFINSLEPGANANFTQSLTLGVDFKDFEQRIQLTDSLDRSPIKYLSWSMAYAATLQTPATVSTFGVTSTFGVRGMVNNAYQFDFNRYLAQPNFMYLRANAQHDRPLVFGSRLFLRVAGQITPAPLINNEQLALGGVDTVRGYLEADSLGDVGYDATAEWRSPSLAPHIGTGWSKAYVFTFVDNGLVRLIDPLPKQAADTRLSSWGAGLRLTGWEGLDLGLEWADPLVGTLSTRAGDWKLLFEVAENF
jgi:hemolysin activation/secretion protein